MSIRTSRLSFAYGHTQILKNLNVSLEAGQLVCVLGQNGAGKSTFFRCLLHLLTSYTGEIYISGRNLKSYSAKELAGQIAYVPQRQESLYHYSVEQMVLMGTCASLSFWETPGEKQMAAMHEALAVLQLTRFRKRDFLSLSGGERQLVLIARAIAQQAGIIVMDEPCASLDYGNQIAMMELSKRLAGEGYLIIQSSHDPDHALLYADWVITLQDGEITGQGKPNRILTEERLTGLYEVPITLEQISGTNKKICVPAAAKKEKKAYENKETME